MRVVWPPPTATGPYTGAFSLTGITLNNSRFAVANSDAGGAGSSTNTTLTTPAFSTVGYSALTLAFQQVFMPDTGTGAVEVSTDGGTTWTAASSYTTQQGTLTTTSATPVTSTVNLGAFLNQSNVRVRWHYTDAWGYIWAVDNVAFTGTAANYTYAYTLVSGNGLPATTTTPSITVTPTQTSVYRLTVSAAGASCTSSATVTVNVIAAPATPTATASQGLVCSGTTATLTGGNLPTGTGFTYQWAYAPGTTGGTGLPAATNTPSITVTPTTTSSYVLTVTNACGLSAASAPAVVNVIAPPAAPVLASTASLLCGGGSATLSLTNVPTGTGFTYQWTLVSGNGLPTTANTTSLTVAPTQTSVYRLTVTNSCNQSSSSDITVTVVTNSIQAYPVPFGDAGLTLAVSTCTAGPVSAQLFDSMGRRVYDQVIQNVPIGNNTLQLPGSQYLGAGKYTLKVQQGNQNLTFNVVRL